MVDERAALAEAMAVLAAFENSSWQQCLLRTTTLEMFISRTRAADSPLRLAAPHELAATTQPEVTATPIVVLSSHLGTLKTAPAEGDRIAAGTVYATLDVLGESVPLRAETSGLVAELLASRGDLVEYQMPVLTLVPDMRHAG